MSNQYNGDWGSVPTFTTTRPRWTCAYYGREMAKMETFVQLFVAGQAITGSARKHSLLLHLAGPATQHLFETLTEPTPAVEDCFKRTIKMPDDNFTTANNTPFERHCFRQIAPNSGETVDQFVARLRRQAHAALRFHGCWRPDQGSTGGEDWSCAATPKVAWDVQHQTSRCIEPRQGLGNGEPPTSRHCRSPSHRLTWMRLDTHVDGRNPGTRANTITCSLSSLQLSVPVPVHHRTIGQDRNASTVVNMDTVWRNRVAPLLARRVGTVAQSFCLTMPFCTNTQQKQAWMRTRTSIPSGFHSDTRVRRRGGLCFLSIRSPLGSQRASLSKFMELTLKFLWTLARLATWLDWTPSANSRWMWIFCHAIAVSVLMVATNSQFVECSTRPFSSIRQLWKTKLSWYEEQDNSFSERPLRLLLTLWYCLKSTLCVLRQSKYEKNFPLCITVWASSRDTKQHFTWMWRSHPWHSANDGFCMRMYRL